jgi:hypothetical protein
LLRDRVLIVVIMKLVDTVDKLHLDPTWIRLRAPNNHGRHLSISDPEYTHLAPAFIIAGERSAWREELQWKREDDCD